MANLFNQQEQQPATPPQGQAQQPQQNFQQALQSLRSNPAAMLKQAGMNVPDNLMGDPWGIINHLRQTGQVDAGRFNQVQAMFGRRGPGVRR